MEKLWQRRLSSSSLVQEKNNELACKCRISLLPKDKGGEF